jgi:hypothetical protein
MQAVAMSLDTNTIRQVQWPSATARAWAIRAIEDLEANRNALAVVFFGSSVRPVPSVGDLDLLIIFEGHEPELVEVPIEVDVRCYSADRVPELISKGHDLLGWAIRYGLLVYERDSYWSDLKAEWQDKLPFPSADIADERADRAASLLSKLRDIGDDDAASEQYLSVLTHRARSFLLRRGVFPISRPELPGQLREAGEIELATQLELTLLTRSRRATTRPG